MQMVRQVPRGPTLSSIPESVADALASMRSDVSGKTVAVTAGSRDITDLKVILPEIIDYLKSFGAIPFVVPAMGSHGGATADGQLAILRTLGLTPESLGCEIRSSMQVVELGRTTDGMTVFMDAHAYAADKVLLVNRIKQHTMFHGGYGSGLLKMLAVGLGKQKGAQEVHRHAKKWVFDYLVQEVHDVYAEKIGEKMLGGVAVLENGAGRTALMEAIDFAGIVHREPRLLEMARGWSPRLPVKSADLLIVDEIGKDISGTGMDPIVIGRVSHEHKPGQGEDPVIQRIFVRDLTEGTHGNAVGIGYADVTTERLVAKIDKGATYANVMTSGMLSKAAVPISFQGDMDAIEAALDSVWFDDKQPSIVRIKNTLELNEVQVSVGTPLLGGEPVGDPFPLFYSPVTRNLS